MLKNITYRCFFTLEDDTESLQRELVDGVDLVQVVEDEVEDRGSCSGRAVELAGLVDLIGGLLCLCDLERKELYSMVLLVYLPRVLF